MNDDYLKYFKPLEVTVTELEPAIAKFRSLVQKEKVLIKYREKMQYEKPSVKKRRKIREARNARYIAEMREKQMLTGEFEKSQKLKDLNKIKKKLDKAKYE